ncbi:uncharacterized protein LOC135682346 [Rhopilema esculentum]|uniref:uncharacterized protein LOC135682346 n=1 Tax=Rhopilema esculentum TaxID=499914 RepID=UPI0031D82BF2
MTKISILLLIVGGLVKMLSCVAVEKKESSFLVQENNVREFRKLRDLLGRPIGDAKTAKATIGKIRKTKFVPKCPKSLMDARKDTLEIILKRCHSLRKKEYKKQEGKVADIIMNADKNAEASYQQQKKALILAVNHLAKLAGPLPSI